MAIGATQRVGPGLGGSTTENPADYREHNADENAGNERKVESEIPFLHGNVARQVSQPAEPNRKSPEQYSHHHQD